MYVCYHDTEMKRYLDSWLCTLLRQSMAFRNGKFLLPSSTDTNTTYIDINGGTSYVNNVTHINNVKKINIINYHTENNGNNGNKNVISSTSINKNLNDATQLIVEQNDNSKSIQIIPGIQNPGNT